MTTNKKPLVSVQVGTRHETTRSGIIEVTDYKNAKEIKVKFINTGSTTVTDAKQIRFGWVKDTYAPTVYGKGYLGNNFYKKKTHPLLYRKWSDMLMRCYSEKYLSKYPTYKGCTVCESWLDFQVFAKWAEANWVDDFDLDKDILVSGNKEYSPDKCMFVSREDNMKKANESKQKGVKQ